MISVDNQAATFLTNSFGDRYLYEVNHNGLNKTGAHQLHEKRLKSLITSENALFIIVGTDSGTLLTYLNDIDIGSGTRVVLLELDSLYDLIAREVSVDPESKQIFYTRYEGLNSVLEEIKVHQYVYIGNIKLVQSLAAEDAFLPEYQELFYKLQSELQRLSWNVEASLGSEPFLIKQLDNLGENITPSYHLRDLFKGKTAVLLAGGPSLDDILPWVQKHRDNLVTFAVSRVCRRLHDVGFSPDFIFSIDPHQVSFDVSKEMLYFWERSLFVHMYHVSPLLLGQWRGRSIFLGLRVPWESALNEESLPHPGPTVSNVAIGSAVEMGFSQVILAGVDLCLSKTGFTHAAGSNESAAGPQLGKICSQVETNGGWMAETTSDFATAIDILDEQAKDAGERGVRLINPSPGAARINSIEHIPLTDIVIEPLEEPAGTTIDRCIPPLTDEDRKNHYRKCIKELSRAQGKLQQIKKLTTEAIQCNDALFGRNGMKQDFRHKKRMDKIENSLNRKHLKFSRLVKSFGIREFLKLTRLDKDKEWDEEEMETTGRNYYKAYTNSASALMKLIRNSKTRLQSRLDELDDTARIQNLAEQWEKDRQPGRAQLWLDRKGLTPSDLAEEDLNKCNELLENFRKVLEDTDTDHMKRSRQFAELTGVRGKIQAFFKQRNPAALKQLVSSLDKHPDPRATQYINLCRGYIYELENDVDRAVEEYQHLFQDLEGPLLEDALRRIASISITRSDTDNGLLALESLSQISPAYLVQYGDLLRLTGAHQDALNSYLNYLENAPRDFDTMIKVGQYYRKLNIEEGARAMFQHVLQLDPENRAARILLSSSQG